eukprot:scaffold174344_cov32-Tisochrysis_lutea.AAC.5
MAISCNSISGLRKGHESSPPLRSPVSRVPSLNARGQLVVAASSLRSSAMAPVAGSLALAMGLSPSRIISRGCHGALQRAHLLAYLKSASSPARCQPSMASRGPSSAPQPQPLPSATTLRQIVLPISTPAAAKRSSKPLGDGMSFDNDEWRMGCMRGVGGAENP